MLDRRGSRPGGPVLPAIAREYNADRSNLSDRLQRVFEAAGIVPARIAESRADHRARMKRAGRARKRAPVKVGFHSLRHTFVSRCAEAGVPAAVVMSIVGHECVAMTQHYTHIGADAARAAVAALPGVGMDRRTPDICCPRCGHRFTAGSAQTSS
jgi:integrase